MQIKVSDYIANFLAAHGIEQVFTVVGGGAMHLNDSFGHHRVLQCLYHHHEQAAAMAAEAYARVAGRLAVVCVTSGPGGINAMNGVAGAYLDSIPMLVISGQMKRSMTTRYTGLKLRSLGTQEFDIVAAVAGMTKYAEMVDDPLQIRYCLEKALAEAQSGRPGPCWLDIPLDVQGMCIEDTSLSGYAPAGSLPGAAPDWTKIVGIVVEKLRMAKRPVLYAGNGIRLAAGVERLHELLEQLPIPVVTCWDSIDLLATDDACYCGRAGIMGDRAGNFAVQNSDLLICIGTRLNILQVGYDIKLWAREAYTIVVDIDSAELEKPTVRVDFPVCADAGEFIGRLLKEGLQGITVPGTWREQCSDWKKRYPVVQPQQKAASGLVNVYAFMDALSHALPDGAATVAANGSASVVGSQSYYIGKDSRFIMNCALSSMGYELPAAIGACMGVERRPIYCIAGDGSMMMNLQELQTIVTNHLPVAIFVINNQGYHQIRQTQNNIFHDGLVGVGPDSGDLSFPDLKKIADAFALPYLRISDNTCLMAGIQAALRMPAPILCEVVVSTEQNFEPKLSTKKLPDGTLVSPPLEDMAPFLPRKELAENMFIPLVEE